MTMRARRAGPLAAVLLCTLLAAPAHAQTSSAGSPPDQPRLRKHPEQRLGGRATPTPTAGATATATATPTAAPSATPKPDLPATGSEPGMVALAGMTLLGFGLSLRLRVALADARRDAG